MPSVPLVPGFPGTPCNREEDHWGMTEEGCEGGGGGGVVSEPDPWKIKKKVWEIGWGGSVPCAWNAGAFPISS